MEALLTSRSNGPAGGGDERVAVPRIGDVAGERDHLGPLPQRRGGLLQRDAVAGVDHEPPAALGEAAGERESEAARGAGDDCGWHAAHATSRAARFPSGIGPRTFPGYSI